MLVQSMYVYLVEVFSYKPFKLIIMAEEKKVDVEFVTSLALVVENQAKDGVDHLQFVVSREKDSGKYRCFFDVVDPSKVKLKESDEVSKPDNA